MRCVAAAAAAVLLFAVCPRFAAAQTVDEKEAEEGKVWFVPRELTKVVEGTSHVVRWYTVLPDVEYVSATVEDEDVARVDAVGPVVRGRVGDNFTYTGEINVTALFIGYNKMHVVLQDGLGDVVGEGTQSMSVLVSYQELSNIFMKVISVFVAFMYVIMGATLDFEVIKSIAKKPLGPLVGIVCQYVFMPLIAFGLAKAFFPDNILAQLGLFLGGCCPGGGVSNMWTHLLGGSLDLSIMMTFVSTVTAFATVPLWVMLLGPTIVQDASFVIPYGDIAVLVFSLSLPCVVGILIAKYLPKVGVILIKMLTPATLFMLVVVFTFGVYANLYVFQLFDAKSVAAGFVLPALGYLSGLALSSLLRLPWRDRIAISIETGIQNMTVAIIILKLTLESPAGDLTVVFPASAVVMTPIPLVTALIIRRVYLCRHPQEEKEEEKEKAKKEEANGNVEGGRGGKVEASGGKTERDGGKVEKNGVAPSTAGGIDNPGLEVEETM